MKTHSHQPPPDTGDVLQTKHPPAAADAPGSTPNSCRPAQPPPSWAWHFRTLVHLRDRLMQAHAEHATEVAAPVEMSGKDVADTAQEQLDRDVLWAELAAEDDRLFEVDRALQRIRDGAYGFCEETGRPIPAERLRAIPWARYCRAVAAQHEQQATDPGMAYREKTKSTGPV